MMINNIYILSIFFENIKIYETSSIYGKAKYNSVEIKEIVLALINALLFLLFLDKVIGKMKIFGLLGIIYLA